MGFFACVNRQDKETDSVNSKEITESHVSSKDSLVEAFVKEKEWANFCKLDEFGPDTILYKRHDLNNNFIGLLDLKKWWVGETRISNSQLMFFPKTMQLYRSLIKGNNKMIFFKAHGKNDDHLVSYFYMNSDTLTTYVSFKGEIAERMNGVSDNYVYVRDIKVKIDNIPMKALVRINELEIKVLELRGLDGTLYGKEDDFGDLKRLIDKI